MLGFLRMNGLKFWIRLREIKKQFCSLRRKMIFKLSLEQFWRVNDLSEIKTVELKSGSKFYVKKYEETTSCGGCNWDYLTLLSFNPETIDVDGLCAECFVNMLFESADAVLQSEPVEVDED